MAAQLLPLSDPDRNVLIWLADEMGTALSTAASALQDSLLPSTAQPLLADESLPALQLAQRCFQRAHEALSAAPMAELEVLCEALATLFETAAKRRRPAPELVLGMADACHAMAAYLAQLRDGVAAPALRLFPYYCRLRELSAAAPTAGSTAESPLAASSAAPASAIDLFFPDLSRLDLLSASAAAPLAAPSWRPLFESALLAFLTGKTPAPATPGMADVLGAVALAQGTARARGRWTALHAFAAMLEHAAQPKPADKRRCGLIHMQLRRLQNGESVPADNVLREILFAIAEAEPAARPPLAQRVAARCQLDELLPADLLTRHYDDMIEYAPAAAGAAMENSAAAAEAAERAHGAAVDARREVDLELTIDNKTDNKIDSKIGSAARQRQEYEDAIPPLELASSLAASLETLLTESERPFDAGFEPAEAGERGAIIDTFDPQNLPVLQKQGRQYLTEIAHHLKIWRQNPADASLAPALNELLHTLQEQASAAGALRLTLALYELALPIQTHLELAAIRSNGAPSQLFDSLLAHYAECERLFEQLPPPLAE